MLQAVTLLGEVLDIGIQYSLLIYSHVCVAY